MKRTCETCNHFCESFVEGQYRCFRTTPAVSSKWDSPACEHYELSKSDFVMAFDGSLIKAREKHPDFVPVSGLRYKRETLEAHYKMIADVARRNVADGVAEFKLGDVLLAEVYEFLEAFFADDFDRVLEEAGDVVAVLYRALNGEGRTGDTGDSGDTGNARKGDGEEVGP